MAVKFLNEQAKEIFNDSSKMLYKVLPLDRVIELLEKKRWAFVSPTLWNDPFEKAFLEAEYKHGKKFFFLPIKPTKVNEGELHYSLFCMCLTETRESEAFWKTYSPNGDGIRMGVKAAELKTALNKIKDFDVFIGKAVYQKYDELYSFQKENDVWKELQSSTINEAHLKMMLKKRVPFEYENEVRILLLLKNPTTKSVARSVPNTVELIRSIKLDPRMGTYMAKIIKQKFYEYGFDKKFVLKSRLYSKPDSSIIFQEDIGIK